MTHLISFGADKEVTGSCHCVDTNGVWFLVDYGLQQGQDEKDNGVLPFLPISVDFVIRTHAHIDHSGWLLLLAKQGFYGKIYMTGKMCELLLIMPRNSAHTQKMDATNENRKGRRTGHEMVEPFYALDDVGETLPFLEPYEYGKTFESAPDVRIRFSDAGHLLGSAFTEAWLIEENITKKVVFSGDIGNKNQPLIHNPQYVSEADFAVMEPIYSLKQHKRVDDYTPQLAELIDEMLANGGNVIIPAFAAGRTQEVLYFIREIKERRLVKSFPDFSVYVDSSLTAEAIHAFSGDLSGYADEETLETLRSGFKPISFSNLNTSQSVDDSCALNFDTTPKVIIPSGGICEVGRVRHYLRYNLWRPECAILLVGYQANGMLGRLLVDGIKEVKLFGKEITVQAQIHSFRAPNGHADHEGLLKWLRASQLKPQCVFIVYGERETCLAFSEELNDLGYDIYAPSFEARYDLLADKEPNSGVDVSLQHGEQPQEAKAHKFVSAFQRLLTAEKQLHQTVPRNEGGANKDLVRFVDQILSLAKRWEW